MTPKQFKEECAKHGLELSEGQLALFDAYYNFLVQENEKMNLTAITKEEDVYEKHFFDSLLPSFDAEIKGKVLDVGSGAGFPGMVLKIAYPEIDMTLLDSNGKRISFLEQLITLLKLDGVRTILGRAEDFTSKNREVFDVVTARAVAPLPILFELCAPAVKKEGHFLAMRGSRGLEEIEEAAKAYKTLGFLAPIIKIQELDEGKRILLDYKKDRGTPNMYPRPYEQIKKRPL